MHTATTAALGSADLIALSSELVACLPGTCLAWKPMSARRHVLRTLFCRILILGKPSLHVITMSCMRKGRACNWRHALGEHVLCYLQCALEIKYLHSTDNRWPIKCVQTFAQHAPVLRTPRIALCQLWMLRVGSCWLSFCLLLPQV